MQTGEETPSVPVRKWLNWLGAVILFELICLFYICIQCVYGYPGRPEEVFLNPLDLELQMMIVSHLIWALGSECRSSERVAYI